MKILAVDTSGKSISLAICEDHALLGEFSLQQGFNHSVTQMPLLEHLFNFVGVTTADIDLFAATVGPGSFTGIRIGVSSVKAMAYACQKPVVGVCSLTSLTYPYHELEGAIICPVIDAGRGRVYGGLWQIVQSVAINILTPVHNSAQEFLEKLLANVDPNNILLAGNGQKVILDALSSFPVPQELQDTKPIVENYQALKQKLNQQMRELAQNVKTDLNSGNHCIRAYDVAQLALADYRRGKSIQAQELMPVYMALSQAERLQKNEP